MGGHKYRSDIDGLRAVAVVAVVLFHAFPTIMPGGFVGVDVFFVISGYLITGIIAGDLRGGTFSLVDFYAKRARRIFPALVVVLIATLMAGWFVLLADEYALLGKHTAGGAAFVANLVLMLEAGYFDISAKYKPLLHLWSLGVEEQFYFVWPALLIGLTYLKRPLVAAAVIVGVCSFVYCIYLTQSNLNEAFYLPHSRFWELMAGAFLALAPGRRFTSLLAQNTASLAGLALIGAGILFIREDWLFPAPAALAPVAGAALIIWAGPAAFGNRWVLGNPVARAVGLISYPLYLWHWPLLSFPAIIQSGDTERSVRIAAVVAAFILAAATYWLIEKPVRRANNLRMTALLVTVALAGVFAAGLYIYRSEGLPERPMIKQIEVAQLDFAGAIWKYTQNDLCKERYPLDGVENYGWWFCMLSQDAAPTVLLLGDSFANHHYAGLIASPAFEGETILSIGTCEPSMMSANDLKPQAETYSPCTLARKLDQQTLIDKIIATSPLDLVIVDGLLREVTEDYIDRLDARLSAVAASGAKVVVMLPHLRSAYYIRGCFDRPLKALTVTCEVPASEAAALKEALRPLVERISQAHPEIAFFDPNSLFCGPEVCSFVKDERPLFRDDSDHLSIFGSELMTANLVDWLKGNRPDILSALHNK